MLTQDLIIFNAFDLSSEIFVTIFHESLIIETYKMTVSLIIKPPNIIVKML